MAIATQDAVEPLKLVPFNDAWITHDKLDLKGIYLRPRYKEDEFGESVRELDERGMPTWDLTAPLPIKQHNKWRAKGFVYVTLGDLESLINAGVKGTIIDPANGEPMDWRPFRQHARTGPWNYKRWLAGRQTQMTREAAELHADVHLFGSAAVEAIRRRNEPDFRLPPGLQGIPPASQAAAEVPVKATPKNREAEARS